MAGFGEIVQKAFYLGVGFASYAGEKAGETLSDLRVRAQKLADEMVARGEMTAEEAKRYVDDWVQRAQQQSSSPEAPEHPAEPRPIEIVDEDDPESSQADEEVDTLHQQVLELQEELRQLKEEDER